MRQTAILIVIIAASFMSLPANARPVSYPGGWTVMLRNDVDINSAHIHYTPDPKHSVGARIIYDRKGDFIYTGVQVNRLIKRWNKVDSQANIYGMVSAGLVTDETSGPFKRRDDGAGFIALAADWETRRYFVSASAEHWERGQYDDETAYHGRLGIAPYVAGTGALHTWVMVEGHHKPESDGLVKNDNVGATALLRFFKGPSLLEVGIDDQGEALLNYIHRF
ncbi:hypothetical protein [Fretibacter rubidus]|uniref:hypothetical protein n=1 Tax=Fretibacter rubidus TaxID=570162 RepID=UPI00352A3EFA